jgi:AcrR family transcriptional regulator
MAKKATSKTKAKASKAGATSGTPSDPQAAIIDAALTLAGQLGWRLVRLDDIADSAGIDMATLYRTLPSKTAIIGAYMRRIDEAVAAGGPVDANDPVKDRLFDVIMRRFDALQPDREGVAAIARDLTTDPAALICLFGNRRRSSNWMLELSGLGSDGFKGRLRAGGLELILLSTMRVWLQDDSRDMSSTMAHLDRQLTRVDQFLGRAQNRGSPETAEA